MKQITIVVDDTLFEKILNKAKMNNMRVEDIVLLAIAKIVEEV